MLEIELWVPFVYLFKSPRSNEPRIGLSVWIITLSIQGLQCDLSYGLSQNPGSCLWAAPREYQDEGRVSI
jgi:hypothetical protein